MNIKEFCEKINELCPLELQEEWDNSGLQINASLIGGIVGSSGTSGTSAKSTEASPKRGEISKVLVALEVSDAIIDEAKKNKVDMIVTHHPLFFGAFKQIVPDMLPTKYAIELIKAGISVYSSHTNFDIMKGGNNDYLGELLGFTHVNEYGIVRYGRPSQASAGAARNAASAGASTRRTDSTRQKSAAPTVMEIADLVSKKINIPKSKIRLIGNADAEVNVVAWCTGAGADYIMDVIDLGADLYITGDIKYHEATTISEFGLNALDIGHFCSEKIFTPNMTDLLTIAMPSLKIIASQKDKDPFVVL